MLVIQLYMLPVGPLKCKMFYRLLLLSGPSECMKTPVEHYSLSISCYTWSVFHSNLSPGTILARNNNSKQILSCAPHQKMLWKAAAYYNNNNNNDFVLVCIHQYYPAVAIMPGVLLSACSWMLLLCIAKVRRQHISFAGLVAKLRLCMWIMIRNESLLKVDVSRQSK